MKKMLIVLVSLILYALSVSAVECGSTPTDGCTVTVNTVFTPGTYNLPNGITVGANDVVLDCNYAVLVGDTTHIGITINSKNHNIIKNCYVKGYYRDIYLEGAQNTSILNNKILDVPTNIGVYIHYSDFTSVIGNNITNTGLGVYFDRSGSGLVRNNYFLNNTREGPIAVYQAGQ